MRDAGKMLEKRKFRGGLTGHPFLNCLFGLLVATLAVILIAGEKSSVVNCIVSVVAYGLGVVVAENWGRMTPLLRLFRRNRRKQTSAGVLETLIGVYLTFASAAFVYWLLPEYHGTYYRPYWALLERTLPWLAFLAIPYLIVTRTVAPDSTCPYFTIGSIVLRRPCIVDRQRLRTHLLFWLIKMFFLPLMAVSLYHNFGALQHLGAVDSFTSFYSAARTILFTVDLLVAVAGYSLSLRLIGTHCRSCEPTLKGWIVCLVCYQPFRSVTMALYLSYSSGHWQHVMTNPSINVVWGSIMLCLLTVYVLSSVAFGCRFSNLTNRGVVSWGPYAVMKHPAYVSKNLFWWMETVPFLLPGFEGVRFCILLIGVNLVYYVRAKTEEAHLMQDASYRDYVSRLKIRYSR